MSTETADPGTVADPGDRVRAVRRRYARRGDAPTARGRAYSVYLTAVLALVYAGPVVGLAATSRPLLSPDTPGATTATACLLTAAAVAAAQLAGRFWGPLILPPFLLHVLATTDLPPERYLAPIARRRLAYAALGTLTALATAALLATGGLLPRALALAAGLAALTPVAWLWGQLRTVRANLLLTIGTAATTAAAALLGPDAAWLLAGATALAAPLLGRPALRALRTADLARLAREAARAADARTFAGTGTLHRALDLYRPEPRGLTTALARPDGRPRGPLAHGAVRALRTPGRTLAGVLCLTAAAVLLALGSGPAGAVLLYAGSGWIGETWRGLRDELTLTPLYGPRGGGPFARALPWPVTAVALATAPAVLLQPPLPALLTAATALLVLSARLLREMKNDLPVELLLPIITPFGDLAAARVFLWQFDGLAAVLTGTLLATALPTTTALLTTLALTAYCTRTALHRPRRSS
ncbi:hypothetical protein [Streptomyces termitum]|uniref:hypothetical protein n=1 Tax=Streptomyces termitum TaxID=67368 RepID=UPI00379045C5